MSSSDSGVNDGPKGFNDDETSSDGYGGLSPFLYDAIVDFKKAGTYPDFCDLKENRNAHFHWRNRCKNFSVHDTGVLLYSGNNSTAARAVVRRGEVRLAIRFVHEKIGHAGQRQTNIICASRLYWKTMHRDVAKFVADCQFCRRKKHIRQKGLRLNMTTSLPSAAEEELEMHELADRLMLSSDHSLGGELHEYYRPPEAVEYAFFEGDVDEPFHHLLDEDDETAVANTLSSMNGTYIMSMPAQQIKMDSDSHSSSSSSIVYQDPSMPMIVTDEFIPAGSNEIVTTMISPSCKLESLPSPSEEEGLHLEDREREEEEERRLVEAAEDEEERERQLRGAMEGMMGDSPLSRRLLARAGQTGTRKRRVMHSPHDGMDVISDEANNKKRLMEENQALRARVSLLESVVHSDEGANIAMQMRPVDEETAAIQKSLLHMQREVLELQRTYWQAKLQEEGFHLQLGDYYEAAGPAEMEEGVDQQVEHHHHYDQEGVEEEEELIEEHRVIEEEEEGVMGNVH